MPSYSPNPPPIAPKLPSGPSVPISTQDYLQLESGYDYWRQLINYNLPRVADRLDYLNVILGGVQ